MRGPIATARGDLVAVLDPVWPGRVHGWWPSGPRPTAGIYVGEHADGWQTVGDTGGQVWATVFAVRLVGDGADQAATAMLDDLNDQVYRAVARSENFYPDASTWAPIAADSTVDLPAYLFTVVAPLDVLTWCRVDPPDAVTIPPVPIGATS